MPRGIILLFAIITALNCLPASSQSDDGWFTGRLSLSCISEGDGGAFQIGYAHYYNIDNRFSVGASTGFIFDGGDAYVPLQSELRVRPFGKKKITPVVLMSGGYVLGCSAASVSPRIGVENGRLSRFRLAADAGLCIVGDVVAWAVGAGVLF